MATNKKITPSSEGKTVDEQFASLPEDARNKLIASNVSRTNRDNPRDVVAQHAAGHIVILSINR